MNNTKQNKILITGGSGLVGSLLISSLQSDGHTILRLVRRKSEATNGDIFWNPKESIPDITPLEGVDAVIHLAGHNVAGSRWRAEVKQEIRDSRVVSTRVLVDALLKQRSPPKVLINASATGFYGSRGDALMTEDSGRGEGFLAEVCQAWEGEALRAKDKGIRVVLLRTGIVLSRSGGALAKMLFPFKLGLGGIIGTGKQVMSWITLDDAISAIRHVLKTESCAGPYNLVSPTPVTNYEFTKSLGSVLNRPTLLPVPEFLLKAILGEMADELLLASTRVAPERLMKSNFQFRFPELNQALRHVLEA